MSTVYLILKVLLGSHECICLMLADYLLSLGELRLQVLVILRGIKHLAIVLLMVLLCSLDKHGMVGCGLARLHRCRSSFPFLISRFFTHLLLSDLIVLLLSTGNDRGPWNHARKDLRWLLQVLRELALAETMSFA